jgi:hypothetical protein
VLYRVTADEGNAIGTTSNRSDRDTRYPSRSPPLSRSFVRRWTNEALSWTGEELEGAVGVGGGGINISEDVFVAAAEYGGVVYVGRPLGNAKDQWMDSTL